VTQDAHFTLQQARDTLSALRDMAPDSLRAPLSGEDLSLAQAVGAEVKGPALGLLDFPTEIEGIAAYWCWQVGESDIEWWHPRDTGFAGRRPIGDRR